MAFKKKDLVLAVLVLITVVFVLTLDGGTIIITLEKPRSIVEAVSPTQSATLTPFPAVIPSPELPKTFGVSDLPSPQPLGVPSIIELSQEIDCGPGSSDEIIADAWNSFEHGLLDRALACSNQVINQFSAQADIQQNQLGSSIPGDYKQYSALNDVGTAWFITGRVLVAAVEGKNAKASQGLSSEQVSALAAFQFAMSRYPSAYALFPKRDGYWPVRQAAFCYSFRYFPAYASQLPAVYTDFGHFSNCYCPSGFMPDKEKYDTALDMNWRENPHSGETCIRVVYTAASEDWEGVYFQFPDKNWGQEPGLDLSRASALTFWARGETGREQIKFVVGAIKDKKYPYYDSLEWSSEPIPLGTDWQQHTVDLSNRDRRSLIGSFAFVIPWTNNRNGATFYLDDIVFVENS